MSVSQSVRQTDRQTLTSSVISLVLFFNQGFCVSFLAVLLTHYKCSIPSKIAKYIMWSYIKS